jgi:hypothetical protein
MSELVPPVELPTTFTSAARRKEKGERRVKKRRKY